jgi:hypothetical protein
MKTKDINKEELDQLQQKAVAKAIRENKALKLAYKTVENGRLVQVSEDGCRSDLGNVQFGTVRVKKRKIKLKK